MAPCYSKNAILQGAVDFFCLVCETYLRSEEDIVKHISKPVHQKNLDSTQYVKEFEEDAIRKIKSGYYCEFCNELLIVLARVRAHVMESSHKNKKTMMAFQRNGLNVIAFGKVVLNDKSWNGFNGESCAVCNTEYETEDIHKNQTKHIVNLIRSSVEIDVDKNVYRKIDEVLFQCLTCNQILALNNKKCHFEGDDHKNQYQKCHVISSNETDCDEKNERNESESLKHNDNKQDSDDTKRGGDESDEKDDDFFQFCDQESSKDCIVCDLALEPQDRDSHFNGKRHKKMLKKHAEAFKTDLLNISESERAYKKCTVSSPCCSDSNREHIEHKKDSDKRNDNLSVKKNNGNDNGEKTAPKETGKENVEAKENRDKVTLEKESNEKNLNAKNLNDASKKCSVKKNLKRMAPGDFLKSVTTVEYMIFHDIVINEKYCISFESLTFLTSRGSELKCMACDKVTNLDHFKKREHENKLNSIPIIVNNDDEFVREIHAGLLHCGYCNVVVFSWDHMEEHFNSANHQNKRIESKWKLQLYLHEISRHQRNNPNRLAQDVGYFMQMMRRGML